MQTTEASSLPPSSTQRPRRSTRGRAGGPKATQLDNSAPSKRAPAAPPSRHSFFHPCLIRPQPFDPSPCTIHHTRHTHTHARNTHRAASAASPTAARALSKRAPPRRQRHPDALPTPLARRRTRLSSRSPVEAPREREQEQSADVAFSPLLDAASSTQLSAQPLDRSGLGHLDRVRARAQPQPSHDARAGGRGPCDRAQQQQPVARRLDGRRL